MIHVLYRCVLYRESEIVPLPAGVIVVAAEAGITGGTRGVPLPVDLEESVPRSKGNHIIRERLLTLFASSSFVLMSFLVNSSPYFQHHFPWAAVRALTSSNHKYKYILQYHHYLSGPSMRYTSETTQSSLRSPMSGSCLKTTKSQLEPSG